MYRRDLLHPHYSPEEGETACTRNIITLQDYTVSHPFWMFCCEGTCCFYFSTLKMEVCRYSETLERVQ
jgi:hypothetical protein